MNSDLRVSERTQRLIQSALQVVREQTPSHLHYHTIEHTTNVIRDTVHLATIDGLQNDPHYEVLVLSAAFHDIGYVVQSKGHEEIGVAWVQREMQAAGFDHSDLTLAADIIMSTKVIVDERGKLFQARSTAPLAGYLQDADLASFGATQPELIRLRELVRLDLGGPDSTEFARESLQFMTDHTWKTPAGRKLYASSKNRNINWLASYLKKLPK